MTVGVPASGKTTWAKRSGARLVTTDGIRAGADGGSVLRSAGVVAARLLRDGFDVAVDACSFDATRRRWWRAIAHREGAEAVAVLVACPPGVARSRNAARGEWAVPSPAMSDYLRRWPSVAQRVRLEPWDRIMEV